MQMPHPTLLLTITAPLVGCTAEPASDPAEARPNVLLITLDTTRADRLGAYGAEAGITPHMDTLATEGIVFERAISTAGITPMSHASILSGLNNYSHGMRVFHSAECSHTVKDDVDLLPEILKRRGYATAATVSAYVVSEIYNLQQGFDTFLTGVETADIDTSNQQRHATEWSTEGRTNTQRRGDLTVTDALSWLQAEERTEQPWFLWVHMFDVHDYSLVPPLDFIADYDIEYPAEGTKFRGMRSHQWRERIYNPELTWMDLQAGRIFEHLRNSGQE